MAHEREGEARIAAVVLAAGASRRFADGCKLMADADGVPLVARVARTLAACAAIDRVVVVVRPGAADIVRCIAEIGGTASCAVNGNADLGMSTSIAAGLAALGEPEYDGVLVTPGDMPGLSTATVERLVAAFAAHGGQVVVHAALPDGRQRNPVVWPRRLLARLGAVTGDTGGKALIREEGNAAVAVPIADERELADIDTVADLAAYHARHRSRREGG